MLFAARYPADARAAEPRGTDHAPARRTVAVAEALATLSALAVAVLGVTVLLGWVTGVSWLTTLGPGFASMKPSTALCLLLLGAAIAVGGVRRRVCLTSSLALPALVLSLLVIIDDAVPGVSWHWLDGPAGLFDGAGPGAGRMAPATALGIALLAVAVVFLCAGWERPAQLAAAGALVVGSAAALGYAYGVQSLYAIPAFESTALRTALSLVVLGIATLLRTTGSGYAALLLGDSAGSVVTRRLTPVAVVGPVLAGFVVARGVDTGLIDGVAGVVALVTGVAVVGAALVWAQGARLAHLDARREESEVALALAHEAMAEREAMAVTLAVSERHARDIVETAAEAYVALDLDASVLEWNGAAEEMFGWSREQALGVRLTDLLLPPAERPPPGVRGPTLDELAAGGAGRDGTRLRRELTIVDRWGRPMTVESAIWVTDDDRGRVVHSLTVDLTDRRAVEVELRRANADLQDFAAAMAHDLRTPLTVIRAATELLATDLERDPSTVPLAERWIPRIDRGTTRGMDLIDDILSFSSLRDRTPAREPVDLAALARSVAGEHVGAATRVVEVEVEDCGSVLGDEVLLSQLASNLVSNAFKYVPRDRDVELRVTASVPPDARGLVLAFEDNGEVLAEDEREAVFTIFQRGRDADDVPGTGVGLAICRRVAELHEGSIRVVPSPRGGNRFEVLLATPVVRRPVAADPAPPRGGTVHET